jgi:hypothetical protein
MVRLPILSREKTVFRHQLPELKRHARSAIARLESG